MKSSFLSGAVLCAALCLACPPAQSQIFNPISYTLANGLQIVIVTGALSPAVTQMVWYKVGSSDDPSGLSGAAHYLEHMMFKGTKENKTGVFSATVAGYGGSENAFTSHDYTAYYENIAADHLPLMMKLEADRMSNLQIDPLEALPERDVVQSERQQRTDNDPTSLYYEKVQSALFGTHPYGRPVIGWKHEIEAIQPEDAQAFYQAHYAPDNAVLVISGDVDPVRVLSLAIANFGKAVPIGAAKQRKALPVLSQPFQGRVDMKDTRVGQASVGLYYVVPSYTQDLRNAHALEVLAEVLGGGEVGLLYQHFVRTTKTAASLSVSYDPVQRGPSVFSVSAVSSSDKDVRALEKNMAHYLAMLARKGVDPKRVEEAKQRLQEAAVFARDGLMAPAQIFGSFLAVGLSVDDVEHWPESIQAVTAQEVNRAFAQLFSAQRQVVGILEPETKEKGL